MTIVVTALGTDAEKGGTIVSVLTGTVVTGDVLIGVWAGDIAPLIASAGYWNGSAYEPWSSFDTIATNTGNVVTVIAYLKVVTTDSSTFAAFSDSDSDTAKAMALYKVTGLAATPFDKSATGTGSGTTAVAGPTATLSQADELVIGAIGMEEQTDEKGTWTTGADYVSGNDQDAGTTGQGGATNISIFGVAEVVAATTAQSAEQTSTGSNDWAACVATYKGTAAAAYIPRHSGSAGVLMF